MRKIIARASRSALLRQITRKLRLHKVAGAWLRRRPLLKKLPGSGVVYRVSNLESIPLAVEMLDKGSLYPDDILPSPLSSFADLGCNVGYFTCWLAHRRGRALKGIMIDANPEIIKEAQWHASANGLNDVHALHGLAGSTQAAAEFYLYDSNICSAAQPLDSVLPELKGKWRKISVPALKIEDVWRERFGDARCDLLKLDIEGLEADFVRLESQFLQRVNVIIAEWHSWGTTKKALLQDLERHGFRFRRVLDDSPQMGTVVVSR